MKNFIKENWFKLLILLAVLFFAYYLIFNPNESEDLTNQIKCQEAGTRLHNSLVADRENDTYGTPEFKFNKSLNTCLYKVVYMSGDSVQLFIRDVYSNKELALWMTRNENDRRIDILGSQKEWEEKVNELFGS